MFFSHYDFIKYRTRLLVIISSLYEYTAGTNILFLHSHQSKQKSFFLGGEGNEKRPKNSKKAKNSKKRPKNIMYKNPRAAPRCRRPWMRPVARIPT